jgi:hypothetical protein
VQAVSPNEGARGKQLAGSAHTLIAAAPLALVKPHSASQPASNTAAAAAAAGVTTPVGAPKPDAWVEVVDKKSGLTYYWNQDSGWRCCRAYSSVQQRNMQSCCLSHLTSCL